MALLVRLRVVQVFTNQQQQQQENCDNFSSI